MRLDYRNGEGHRNHGEERAEKLLMGCPVCGGKAEIWYHPQSYGPDRPFVRCSECGLSSADSYYTVSHSYSLAFAKLVVGWNARVGSEKRDEWLEIGSRFDEGWKIPHYSGEFFAKVFEDMEALMPKQEFEYVMGVEHCHSFKVEAGSQEEADDLAEKRYRSIVDGMPTLLGDANRDFSYLERKDGERLYEC